MESSETEARVWRNDQSFSVLIVREEMEPQPGHSKVRERRGSHSFSHKFLQNI